MVDCLSWYSCYGSLRLSSKLYSKEKRPISKIQKQVQNSIINKSSLSCVSSDAQSKKKQHNINNNNNTSPQTTDEQNTLLHFYIFDVSRERSLHLSANSYDKRLLIFYNISNGLYKIGLRNGDVLIYLNETNIVKPPIALTIDRVKSEFTALRRQNKTIKIGICRCSDRSLFNNTTIKHLGSLTYHEFENLSQNEESMETRKSSPIVNTDSKKLLNLFSNKKKSVIIQKQNSNRDSGFVETDVDHSLISNSNKPRSNISPSTSEENQSFEIKNTQSSKQSNGIQPLDKHRNLPTEIFTDACFIYRRQIIKQPTSNTMILRGREIAYEAANSLTIPSSMPNYTHDQIRELYGELDRKSRRLQENEYILHTPMIDAWKEKSPWNISSSLKECPLPKFRVEKNDQTLLMAAYLSTGLSNNPRTLINTNDKEIIRGSFRTSIADRTTITPSPLLLNVRLDFNKLLTTPIEKQTQTPTLAKTPELMDADSLIDLSEETIIPKQSHVETNSLVTHDSCYYDTLTLPEQNIFPENFSEESEIFSSVNSEEKSPINDVNHTESLTDNQKEEIIIDKLSTTDQEHELSVKQFIESKRDLNFKESDFFFNEENDYDQITSDIDEDFEELYQRYLTNLDQYETILQQIDEFEQKKDLLTPISEESITLFEHNPDEKSIKSNHIDEFCLTLTVQREFNHIGHYGFELEQTFDGKIKVSSIINSNYCPNLNIDDEILTINNHSTLTTLEQCHLLFHSLWHSQYDYVEITVRKAKPIPIISPCEPMSLQSSSLSWPLSIVESGKIIAVFF